MFNSTKKVVAATAPAETTAPSTSRVFYMLKFNTQDRSDGQGNISSITKTSDSASQKQAYYAPTCVS